MASERNMPPAADEPDDIVERTPSHPVTTTLLIVSTVALLMAIGLSMSELGRYVNPATKSQLENYKISALEYYKRLPESGEAASEGEAPAAPVGRRKRPAPAEQPSAPEAPAPAPTPADGDKPAPAEGGSGN